MSASTVSTAAFPPNRAGLREGQVSELTVIVPLKEGGAAKLGAILTATFESLKREWIHSGNFLGLGTEEDPIAGEHAGTGMFTIPMRPIRRRLQGLERFTITRGGEYGFLPSLSALRWLAVLLLSEQQPLRVFREGRDG